MACVTLTGGVGSGGMLATGGRPMQSLTGSLEKATLFQTPLPPLNRQEMVQSSVRHMQLFPPAALARTLPRPPPTPPTIQGKKIFTMSDGPSVSWT